MGLEKQVWNAMIKGNKWELMEILESVLKPFAVFSRASSQTEQIVTFSHFLIMKCDFYDHLQGQSFNTIDREQIRQLHETYKTIASTANDRSDFALVLHHASSG